MTISFRARYALLTAIVFVSMAACEDVRAAEPIAIGTASPGGVYLTWSSVKNSVSGQFELGG
jgi:hypothetical protein